VYCSADVDDLAQEVFIAAYRDLKSFREGEDFGSWLRGIARNRLLTYFRSQRRRTGALERFQQEAACVLAGEVEASFQGEGGERMERLLGCISKLPDRLRRVVRSGLREEKPALLAEELGTSVAAIYQMHYRAGKMLRECLGTGASF
jgi:RNA polymerase sigma-70 factor (ECF subfamily)